MTFNSFMDGWRTKNLKVLGLSADACVGTQYWEDSCGTIGHSLKPGTRKAEPQPGGSAAGIHTGRTIEDLVEQVSRRVDALPRVLAKQEARRKEIEEELSE